MSRHHKLVYGSLFVFFAATHAGCAGSGLKNMFTRNETDGYHSLDELETKEASVAENEASGDEVQKPSMATRLASWRPFSKTDPTAEETSAAIVADSLEKDSEDAGTIPRFPGRVFTKRGSVEPDPFLSAEPKLANRPESSAFGAVPHKEIAKINDKSKKVEDEFAFEAGPKPKSTKDEITVSRKSHRQSESTDDDTNAFALKALRVANAGGSDEEDDALAERFEQHFLQNSIGTVAKTKTEAAGTGNDLRQRVSTRAESKKRELSSIADRQISQFDFLLAADPDSDGKTPETGRNADIESSKSSKRQASTTENSGNALAAFDQLLGTEANVAPHAETEGTEIELTSNAARSSKKKDSARDINVADAEALFGAAAARQNTRLAQSETAHRTDLSDRHAESSSAWSPTSENPEGFDRDDSRQGQSGSPSNRDRGDVSIAFARRLSGTSGHGMARIQNTAFSAPQASAGNVEDDNYSAEETPDTRLSNASAFSNEHRVVAANYGTAQPNVRHSAATETSAVGDVQFTAAPVAPDSRQEFDSEVSSNATRPGLVQSFSTRNWLLLLGGVIVIALLFAPGRTKPLTMNSRPANG